MFLNSLLSSFSHMKSEVEFISITWVIRLRREVIKGLNLNIAFSHSIVAKSFKLLPWPFLMHYRQFWQLVSIALINFHWDCLCAGDKGLNIVQTTYHIMTRWKNKWKGNFSVQGGEQLVPEPDVNEIQARFYGDTSCVISDNIKYEWPYIDRTFKEKSYPDLLEDEQEDGHDKEISPNITRWRLLHIARRPTICPCSDTVSLLIDQDDTHNKWIVTKEGMAIASY